MMRDGLATTSQHQPLLLTRGTLEHTVDIQVEDASEAALRERQLKRTDYTVQEQ